MGAAFVVNGISADHRRYLALGGLGFLLGDGGLTYGLEKIFETYYTAHVWRGIYFATDYQHVTNPGYNEVRGPVDIVSFGSMWKMRFRLTSLGEEIDSVADFPRGTGTE